MILKNMIQKKEKLPLLNYIHNVSREPFTQEYYQIDRKRRMKYLINRSPETTQIVDGHARDICGKYHFEPVNNTSSGKILVNRAKRFAQRIKYKEQRLSAIKDALMTGEGFIFISELEKKYAEQLAEGFRRIDTSFNDISFRVRKAKSVASTTMAIIHDEYEVIEYVQSLYGNAGGYDSTRTFPKDKIMHFAFEKDAGRVEGYTPFFTIPLHLELLWLMWDNQYDFQVKGNHPDLVVMAETLDRNKNAFNQVSKNLASYNEPGNSKHGTLLLTGDKFDIQQLERMDTLQFKEVDMFISSLIAGLVHYPQNRLSIKTDQSAKDKDSTGGSEKFYYSVVEQKQDTITEVENEMFWIKYFGVRLVQDKSYKHDQIEEGTAQQLLLGNLNTAMQMLDAEGYTLKKEKILDIFNNVDITLTTDDLEEGRLLGSISSTMNNQLSNSDAMDQGMSRSDRAEKRKDEAVRERSDGKPNGITR